MRSSPARPTTLNGRSNTSPSPRRSICQNSRPPRSIAAIPKAAYQSDCRSSGAASTISASCKCRGPGSACGRHSAPGRTQSRIEPQSAEIFGEEGEGARLRFFRALCIIAVAFIAVETVIGRIDKDGYFRMRGLDLLDIAHRDVFVALAEMQQDRHARLFVHHISDAAAVIADCGGDV